MSGEQTVAGMRRYLAEELGEFAAMEFDRMLAEARTEGAAEVSARVDAVLDEADQAHEAALGNRIRAALIPEATRAHRTKERDQRDAMEPCAEFGQHPRGGHERAVKQAVDFRGRAADCFPFCQGGLHEVGCPSLDPPQAALTERDAEHEGGEGA